MSAVLVLAAIVAALLLPLAVAAVRQPGLVRIAARNVARRRGEAVLVVTGSLLGTAIITSSFVVGDVIDGSITDAARTQLGPVDVRVAPADPSHLDAVVRAVEAAGVDRVDGLLTATSAVAALEHPAVAGSQARAIPSTRVVELDLAAAKELGGSPSDTGLAGLDPGTLRPGTALLHERSAARLDAVVGDRLRLHAYGDAVELEVAAVVPEVGLAGYGGAIVAPGTFDRLVATATPEMLATAAPPRGELLVSLEGGVFGAREHSDAAVAALRAAVTEIPGVEVAGVKAALLDGAEREGQVFSELFSSIGSFSVLAGVLLLVNLFVMLAEERKTELGMLRALGFTRRRLVRAFALEGALYAVLAALIGTLLGVVIGWLVALAAGRIFGVAEQGIAFRLVVDPVSLMIGGLAGLAISLATIWATSLRIARLNVIRAIRDLPEPRVNRVRLRTVVLGSLGVVAGLGMSWSGVAAGSWVLLILGVPVAAFSATPLLRRLLPERVARLGVAVVVVAWGFVVFPLFEDRLGGADIPVFVAQGAALTAGAVSLAATLDHVWGRIVERLAARGRGLAARLGLAYPLARRFRTSMLLGMFSLVVLTMTFIAALSASFEAQTQRFAASSGGGADLLVSSNPANPVDAAALEAREDVASIAALARSFVRFDAAIVDEPRGWPVTGFDEGLVRLGPPALATRDEAYPSDEAVYEAVLEDPALVVVSDWFLQSGGPAAEAVGVGDRVSLLHPLSDEPHELTVVGVTDGDWAWNGAFVSRELTRELLGPMDVASRLHVAVADGIDAPAVAAELDVELIAHGGEAATFVALVEQGMREQTSFFTLLQSFLGLGLLVGIAGLGVVMVRAVRERRREIGMLRAVGFQTGLVRRAFLSEAGLIAVQGTSIGIALGLLTARQVLTSSAAFGEGGLGFSIPWVGLAVVALVPVAASLAATAWPAARAAATRPAVALRVAD